MHFEPRSGHICSEIFSLPLIQEGELSVIDECTMHTPACKVNKNHEHKIVNIFLSISFNICFEYRQFSVEK